MMRVDYGSFARHESSTYVAYNKVMPEQEETSSEEITPELEVLFSGLPSRYQFRKLIGKGGMGAVFLAFDAELGRDVAVKLLLLDAARDEELLHRFSREAKTLATLNHANIVKMLSWGVTAQGCPYHVLEYLEGQALSAEIAQKGKLKSVFIHGIFPQIFSGLQHAHESNVVHRDLKPSNIMICKSKPESAVPLVKLIDFGIARLADDQTELKLTQTNTLLGSPAYMSPEQCQAQEATQSSDIYSLGCIMYEACTGKPPFTGENAMELMYKHVNADWEHLESKAQAPDLKQLGKLIDSCLAKEAKNRPGSVKEIANRFQEINRLQADSLRFFQPGTQMSTKSRIFVSLAVVLASALSVVFCFQLKSQNNKTDEEIKQMMANKDLHSRLLRQEKDYAREFNRLKLQFERESKLERKREQVENLMLRGRALSLIQRRLLLRKEAEITLRSLFQFTNVMDEPKLSQADLLRTIIEFQIEDKQFDLALQNIEKAKSLLGNASDASEDGSILNNQRFRAYLGQHKYEAALYELKKLTKLWGELPDPRLYAVGKRNAFLPHSKDKFAEGAVWVMHDADLQKPNNDKDRLGLLMIYNEFAAILLEREPSLASKAITPALRLAGTLASNYPGAAETIKKTNELDQRLKDWQKREKETQEP